MRKWVTIQDFFIVIKFKSTLQMIGPSKTINWHVSTTNKTGSKNHQLESSNSGNILTTAIHKDFMPASLIFFLRIHFTSWLFSKTVYLFYIKPHYQTILVMQMLSMAGNWVLLSLQLFPWRANMDLFLLYECHDLRTS